MLEVERVTRHERLRELEPRLQALFERDGGASPFQSPAWLLTWAEHFAPAGSLRSVVVHARERTLAWLPLRRAQHGDGHHLGWLGAGISDRLDALSDPDAGLEPLELAARELCAWSRDEALPLELDELPEGSPLAARLRSAGARLEPCSPSPRLELNASGSPPEQHLLELEQQLPGWLRRNLRQTAARLARQGELEWRAARGGNVGALLDPFLALHAARWRARQQPGVLAHPSVEAFHRAVAPRLVEQGLLELDVLYRDDRPLAATYVLRRTDAHLYLFGFDPSDPRLSLGSFAVWRSLQRAALSGARRYDFLRGREPYKYAFGAHDAVSQRCSLAPLSMPASPGARARA